FTCPQSSVARVSSFRLPPSPTYFHPLSLHDALPISHADGRAGELNDIVPFHRQQVRPVSHLLRQQQRTVRRKVHAERLLVHGLEDRKSTRLNSSHGSISYDVFCLKKKNILKITILV